MQQQVRTPHGRTAITTAAIMTKTKAASIQSIRSLKKVGQALKWLNHWIHCQTNWLIKFSVNNFDGSRSTNCYINQVNINIKKYLKKNPRRYNYRERETGRVVVNQPFVLLLLMRSLSLSLSSLLSVSQCAVARPQYDYWFIDCHTEGLNWRREPTRQW
jgi:hypothetical protein